VTEAGHDYIMVCCVSVINFMGVEEIIGNQVLVKVISSEMHLVGDRRWSEPVFQYGDGRRRQERFLEDGRTCCEH
jgi:hypothetical protein